MKPTVGRIVHFYTADTRYHVNGQGAGPYAAIVTQVCSEQFINLKVLAPFGETRDEGSVPHRDDFQNPSRYWCWAPRE